jgi:hypothetical protein
MPAFLARRYDDTADVEQCDGAPTAFTWRGRRYFVAHVLGHWWETGAWWHRLDEGVDDDEREIWRVEATTRGRASVVVELAFAWSRGTWSLVAVLD